MARTKAFDEDVVLDRAVELFWDQGYEATSISDLEEHLGVGRQSLYNTFGDKRELFVQALQRYASQNRDKLVAALGEPDAGWKALNGHLHGRTRYLFVILILLKILNKCTVCLLAIQL